MLEGRQVSPSFFSLFFSSLELFIQFSGTTTARVLTVEKRTFFGLSTLAPRPVWQVNIASAHND
jgi:hypothetical protein